MIWVEEIEKEKDRVKREGDGLRGGSEGKERRVGWRKQKERGEEGGKG